MRPSRPGQKAGETAMEYLSRAVSNLEDEPCHLLEDLSTVDAVLDFFDLWHAYDTDYWEGILECIGSGEDPKAAREFVAKHKLPKSWTEQIDEMVESHREYLRNQEEDDADDDEAGVE